MVKSNFQFTIVMKHLYIIAFFFFNFILQVYSQNDNVNIALNKPAVASSTESDDYKPGNSDDGKADTKWSSTSASYKNWIYIDLGARFEISKVVLKWGDGFFASTYDLQISDDASEWSTIYTIDGNKEKEINANDNLLGTGRYIKMNGRGRGAGTRYRIAEFEVYGIDPSPTTPLQQVSIDTITNRLLKPLITSKIDEANLNSILATFRSDGSWPDVDYEIVKETFPAGTHLYRLKEMAMAYRTPGNSSFESATLRNQIMKGLDYYLLKDPKSTNWWYNDIGAPDDYMIPVILLKGKISKEDLFKYSSHLKNQIVRFAGGGKNLSWIANITMYKACIEDDYKMLDAAFKAVYSSLVIVPNQGDEGIKIDNSFHQHHAQLYSGGYGMSIMDDFANTIQLAEGTDFINSISASNRQVLSNVLLKGHQLLGYRSVIDFGSRGRNISRPAPFNYSNIAPDVLEKMMKIDNDKTADYQAWIAHLAGAPFPESYRGNTHFWKSDIMVQHGANYYISAKIISKRTYGTESLNGENTKGYNLPLGATNILTDGNEYEGIFASWDWTRVPGTTAEHNQDSTALDSYLIGSNDFGGGVSNGTSGIIAYEHNYRKVQAKKAYFYMNDAMLCLGAGINANGNNPVLTSVNQCFSQGEISYNSGSGTQKLTDTKLETSNLKWVHHRNVGYILPDGGNITVQKMQQSGSWKDINVFESSSTVNSSVFSLWFDHSSKPVNNSYQYIAVPDKSLVEFEASVTNHGFVVITNNADLQAVKNTKTDEYAIVFYKSGTAELGDGFTVSSDKAAMVLLKNNPTGIQITVSDPTYSQANIKLTISKKLKGGNVEDSNNGSIINVNLPTGDFTGSSVSVQYDYDASTGSIILPENDKLEIFPNPASDKVYVRFRESFYSKIELIDLYGKILQQIRIAPTDRFVALSLEKCVSTNYFVRLTGENNQITKQIIKLK